MRHIWRVEVVAFALCAMFIARIRAQERAPRPNILYIVSDGQGWKDLGYHGSDIKTPNIAMPHSSPP
jgi:hypothetical protein